MWTSAKQKNLNDLRCRELEGTLTPAQQTQLSRFFDELNREEEQLLAPHLKKLDTSHAELAKEVARVNAENERLARVVSPKKILVRKRLRYRSEKAKDEKAIVNFCELPQGLVT